MRGCPAPCTAASAPRLLTARLARLAADHLALVLDALALVRLRRTERPDLGRDLPHHFLVGPGDLHGGGIYGPQGDALRGLVVDGMAVAERERQPEGLGLGAVAHAHDVERLGETGGDTLHHVGHQGAAEAVQRAMLRRVAGALDHDLAVGPAHADLAVQGALELALGTLHPHVVAIQLHIDPRGDGDGPSSDTRHDCPPYQTMASSSPPTLAARACRSVITPREVLSSAIPSPLRTRGISSTPTYWRSPGLDTRRSSRITGLSWKYFRYRRSTGWVPSSRTLKSWM